MKKTLCIYKPVGETPLQTLQRFKVKNKTYENKTLSFAGRLDPMAEGLLLILVGEENKKRKQYEALKKDYEFSVLFGISTDSYDLLGIPILKRSIPLNETDEKKLQDYLAARIGKHNQAYPPFSSKTVQGKPLYYWAREKRLDSIEIPSKSITISALNLIATSKISSEAVLKRCKKLIPMVKGQFRQDEILASWENLLSENHHRTFSLFTFLVTCSSGTYVRGLAHEMGTFLKTGALAFSIKRTHIGDLTLEDALRI